MDAFPKKFVPDSNIKTHSKNMRLLKNKHQLKQLRLRVFEHVTNENPGHVDLMHPKFSVKVVQKVINELGELGWYAWTEFGDTALFISRVDPDEDQAKSSSDESC